MDGKLRNMTAIYLRRKGELLLLFREGGSVVDRVWTGSAGGHVEREELNDPKACVVRELEEELGLGEEDLEDLRFRYLTFRYTKGEIRQNYYFFANLKEHVPRQLRSTEGVCKWFREEELGQLEMPLTAKYVVEHYLKEGQRTKELYVGVAGADGVRFSPLWES